MCTLLLRSFDYTVAKGYSGTSLEDDRRWQIKVFTLLQRAWPGNPPGPVEAPASPVAAWHIQFLYRAISPLVVALRETAVSPMEMQRSYWRAAAPFISMCFVIHLILRKLPKIHLFVASIVVWIANQIIAVAPVEGTLRCVLRRS